MKNVFFISRLFGRSAQTLFLALAIGFGMSYQSDANAQNAGNIYGADQVLLSGSAEFGLVLQVEIKQQEASPQARGTAAGLGAAVGGLLAAGTGNAGWGKNTLGALVGGLVGERAANYVARTESQEIVVQLISANESRPRLIVLVQPAPFDQLSPGDKVLVTNIAGKIRVKPNNTGLNSEPKPYPQGQEMSGQYKDHSSSFVSYR